MKGVILAGGYGTRLHPLTHSICKQLLPVYDKPMIYYPIWTLMLAHIKEILLIVTEKDLPQFRQLLGDGTMFDLQIKYKIQEEPLGIAHALILAEEFVGRSPFALVLGDNIFHGMRLESLLLKAKQIKSGARIFTYPSSNPSRYGVVSFDKNNKIQEIIEKPEKPPSNQIVTGLYFYDHKAVSLAKNLKPSKRGELEITDLNNCYLQMGELEHEQFGLDFAWMDSGTFESLHEASCYVRMVQKMHNCRIGCIHTEALKKRTKEKQLVEL